VNEEQLFGRVANDTHGSDLTSLPLIERKSLLVEVIGENDRVKISEHMEVLAKEHQPERVLPKVSQQTLAEMIGTTRSRVTFFMNKFRKMGFIEYNGKIKVNKTLLTVVLHE
jgi:CRP/FNR family transcriptional regulator, cyclic AMP receptor protein